MLTDQNPAIAMAIAQVMQKTHHGLYTFHIRRNFVKCLGNHFIVESLLLKQFVDCKHKIEDEDEFSSTWYAMLAKHKVEHNSWLTDLFNLKEKWARL